MTKQQESKTNEQKLAKNNDKEIIVERIFLGEFSLDEYFEKEASRILAKLK